LARLALAFLIVLGPASGWFGFVPLSGSLLTAMAAVTVAYLSAAEVAKHFAIARNS
jgi:P-type Mg2+ transporter